MGCNTSRPGEGLSQLQRNTSSKNLPAGARPTANIQYVNLARKMSIPTETVPQRRRLSVAHIDGTGVVDEDVERYVYA